MALMLNSSPSHTLCFLVQKDVANFATLVATYMDGFAVITEPQGTLLTIVWINGVTYNVHK